MRHQAIEQALSPLDEPVRERAAPRWLLMPSVMYRRATPACRRFAIRALSRHDSRDAAPAAGWFGLDRERVLLRVDHRGARYPLRIDPLIQQGEKLTGVGEVSKGEFGWNVALSSDGNTALMGLQRQRLHRRSVGLHTRRFDLDYEQAKLKEPPRSR